MGSSVPPESYVREAAKPAYTADILRVRVTLFSVYVCLVAFIFRFKSYCHTYKKIHGPWFGPEL